MLLHSHTTLQTRILLLVMVSLVWSIFLHNQFISQCISSEYLCGFRTGINLRCCDKHERPWWTRSTSYYLLMWNWMVQSDFSSIFLLCCKSCYFSFWIRPRIRVIMIQRCQFVAEFPEIRHSRIISSTENLSIWIGHPENLRFKFLDQSDPIIPMYTCCDSCVKSFVMNQLRFLIPWNKIEVIS